MIGMKKFLLNNTDVYIENSAGVVVSFSSLESLAFYAPEFDLSEFIGLDVCYEPARGIFTTFDGINTVGREPIHQTLESIISSVAALIARKANPIYGLGATESRAVALSRKLAEIDIAVLQHVGTTFPYMGHNFYVDVEFIQGVYTALPVLPEDYTETWKTSDVQEDGITNIYVTLDKAGITGLAIALLQHKKTWWDAGEQQKQVVKSMAANQSVTPEEILAYEVALV